MDAELQGIAILIAVAIGAYLAVRYALFPAVVRATRATATMWDDILADASVQNRADVLVPLVVVRAGLGTVLESGELLDITTRLGDVAIMLLAAHTLGAMSAATNRVYLSMPGAANRPIKGYLQIVMILVWAFVLILVVARLVDQPLGSLFTGLGAISAVLILVFQDTLLSIVASVRISNGDMVRIGDWIEMPTHGVNGTVTDLALHTVTVENFDRTITTIPTRQIISEGFKNWRGMEQSGARRIMRSLPIDASTIRYLTDDQITTLSAEPLLSEYLADKRTQIDEWNARPDTENRHLTNLGTFRAYVEMYLRRHPRIDQTATLLVRQLPPTGSGLPIEVYAFTATTEWGEYEAIQADIFDHLIARLPVFDLRMHQAPTGYDFVRLRGDQA